jgi:ATP-binding cassette subfamily B (MDR/TAP) protein 1
MSEKDEASPADLANDRLSKTSSSIDDAVQKPQVGGAPLPVQPNLPVNEQLALQKLDSKKPKDKTQDEEKEDPFGHLPAHEKEILHRQVDVPEVKVGYFTLYRYCTRWDWTIWVVSCFCTIAAGAAMPLMTVRIESFQCWQ